LVTTQHTIVFPFDISHEVVHVPSTLGFAEVKDDYLDVLAAKVDNGTLDEIFIVLMFFLAP
jgi:hypothetical protein